MIITCSIYYYYLCNMDWNSSIKGFKAYLLLEKSLSGHSIEAYIRDVGKLLEYVLIKKIDLTPDKLNADQLADEH